MALNSCEIFFGELTDGMVVGKSTIQIKSHSEEVSLIVRFSTELTEEEVRLPIPDLFKHEEIKLYIYCTKPFSTAMAMA